MPESYAKAVHFATCTLNGPSAQLCCNVNIMMGYMYINWPPSLPDSTLLNKFIHMY